MAEMNARNKIPHRDKDLPVFLTSVSGEDGGWVGMTGAGDSSILPDDSEGFAAPC